MSVKSQLHCRKPCSFSKMTGLILTTAAAVLLGGCAQTIAPQRAASVNTEKLPASATGVVNETQTFQSAMLNRCSKELEALKQINPEEYHRRKAAFTRLMTVASQYASVRNDVNAGTQGAVDSLYQYRSAIMCADISHTLLTALSDKGGVFK
ncbi:hypothetical protein ACWWJF_01525 (plasmid) [Symbiopectobacterium sp. Eva_TO]